MGKRKHESKCPTCSGQYKSRTKRPYGAKGTNPYCSTCDVDYTYSVSKKSERNKAKKDINKQLEEK